MSKEVWYCEKHDAMGQHAADKDQCDVAQLVECMLGWPSPCVLRRASLTDLGPRDLDPLIPLPAPKPELTADEVVKRAMAGESVEFKGLRVGPGWTGLFPDDESAPKPEREGEG